MSSLTEQERIGLEEVFLSISSSRGVMHRWSSWAQTFSLLSKVKKFSAPFTLAKKSNFWSKNSLKQHKITKLFNKTEKRRKI